MNIKTGVMTEEEAPPTEWEIDMAFTWTILNTIRLFHGVPVDSVLPAEQRFLERWRAIPAKRRQVALDWPISIEPTTIPRRVKL